MFAARGGPTHPLVGMELKVSYDREEPVEGELQRAVEHFIAESGEGRKKVKEETKRGPISTLDKVMAQYLMEMA